MSSNPTRFRGLAAGAAVVALSAYAGATGLATGWLAVEPSMRERLPMHSPVLGGVALALAVAAPMTWLATLAWLGHVRAREASTIAGLALIGWIVVEVAVIRQVAWLQAAYALVGVAFVLVGDRRTLRQAIDVIVVLPVIVVTPLLRPWHLRWGATSREVLARMAGDDLLQRAQFVATRAITIAAPPEDVWPWLTQVGFGRAGFYSYDLLDNLGRPSAETTQPRWQSLHAGDLVAPMAGPPTEATSFRVAVVDPPSTLVWSKPDSTWTWQLDELSDGGTRLVTRLEQAYHFSPSGLLSLVLAEFGDFVMMRRMLLGVRTRAERAAQGRSAGRRL